jgi:putative membrane protein
VDHDHGSHDGAAVAAWAVLDSVAFTILGVAALAYAAGVVAVRSGAGWPVHRIAFWYVGIGCAAAALIGPVAGAARTSFTAHMAGHLLLGMVAPLSIALAAPVTLLLRALPVDGGRVVAALLRSRIVRVVSHPLVAAGLNGGGLWLLYTSDLYSQMHSSPVLYGIVHLHIFLAGFVFTAAVVGVDPNPHRAAFPLRATVLVAFIAAHSILAKWLYAHPPPGVEPRDAQIGAQLMYYGGDVVDVTLIVLLFLGWYRAARPRQDAHASAARPG